MTKTIRVIPVLLPHAAGPDKADGLPRFLRRLIWVDLPESWQSSDALYDLICGIKGVSTKRSNI